jgi:hypothetical protein
MVFASSLNLKETGRRIINREIDMSLESEFERALRGTYEAARKRGYVATYFLQMLQDYGAIGMTKRLLAKSEPQTGLFELWKLNLLNESMEAVIWDNSRFHPLFTLDEIGEARHRLEALGYFEK